MMAEEELTPGQREAAYWGDLIRSEREEKEQRTAEIKALRTALLTALSSRCDNRKCESCEPWHEDQPSREELDEARATLGVSDAT